jgi:hypothetical protein
MPHGVRIMVAYVFLPKEAASPRLEALKEDASEPPRILALKNETGGARQWRTVRADGLPPEAKSPEQQSIVATT